MVGLEREELEVEGFEGINLCLSTKPKKQLDSIVLPTKRNSNTFADFSLSWVFRAFSQFIIKRG